MGCMQSEVYDALRLAGVPDDAAKSAAEAVFTANMALRQEINQTVKEVGDKTDQAVKELGDRIDKVDQKLGDRINKVVDRIISLEKGQAVHSWMLTSLCGMMITLLIKTFWPS